MINKSYIYQFLALIPKGKVVSYKQIGQLFGIHPRYVARIMGQNEDGDTYPCYKVLNAGGKLGGYTNEKGLDEKVRRLKKDKIEIVNDKVADDFFWKPKYSNFFLAIPIKEKGKFKKLHDEIKQVDKDGILKMQKFDSPHITLSFFGKMSLGDFQKIKNILEDNKDKILSNKAYRFDKTNDFDRKSFFLGTHSSTIIKDLTEFNNKIHKILGIEPEKRNFHPHITVFKSRGIIDRKLDKKLIEIMNRYEFEIDLSKLTFYAAIDQNFQTPLFDVVM